MKEGETPQAEVPSSWGAVSTVAVSSGPFPGCGCIGLLAGGGGIFPRAGFVTRRSFAVLGGAPRGGSPPSGGLGVGRVGFAFVALEGRPRFGALAATTPACCFPASGRLVEVAYGQGGGGGRAGPGCTKQPPEGGRLSFLQAHRAEGSGGGREG